MITDATVLEALRIPRINRLTYWNARLEEHKGHGSFRVHSFPHSLEYGFTCNCTGTEQEFRIDIGSLKSMVPAARDAVLRLWRHHGRAGMKGQRRSYAKSQTKARALLHRYLTKEQRTTLRKLREFTMTGKDGRTYVVTEGSGMNVFLEHKGVKYRLCVVPKTNLPTFDVWLAQKVMLETDPEAFIRLARVVNTETREVFESGGFILGDEPQRVLPRIETVEIIGPRHTLTEEQIANPREWVEARLGITEEARLGEHVETLEPVAERVETRDA